MKKVVINGVEYEVIRNDQDCLDTAILEEKLTDYFDSYDYIFGDYAYEKVRLKGYYESNNKNANKINDIKYLDDYIKEYCSYGSKTFLLKKVR
ncbi:MAG: YutD family protein [Bacilli bacterium]|nr:YutD family protein [Bacilli bacterium]